MVITVEPGCYFSKALLQPAFEVGDQTVSAGTYMHRWMPRTGCSWPFGDLGAQTLSAQTQYTVHTKQIQQYQPPAMASHEQPWVGTASFLSIVVCVSQQGSVPGAVSKCVCIRDS